MAASGTGLRETSGAEPSPHIRTTEGSHSCNACRGWMQAGGALMGLEGVRSFKSLCPLSPHWTGSTWSICFRGLHSMTSRWSLSCSAREEPAEGQKYTQLGWDGWAQQWAEVPWSHGDHDGSWWAELCAQAGSSLSRFQTKHWKGWKGEDGAEGKEINGSLNSSWRPVQTRGALLPVLHSGASRTHTICQYRLERGPLNGTILQNAILRRSF